jgi:hypothetical protein
MFKRFWKVADKLEEGWVEAGAVWAEEWGNMLLIWPHDILL